MLQGASQGAVNATIRSLAIDGVTAEAVSALEAVGLTPILLKGPVIARWLYADGSRRSYGDTDLLVAPHHERQAEQVLAALRFTASPGTGRAEPGIARNHIWTRGADVVELHITLTGIGASPADVWACLSHDTGTIEFRERSFRTLGLPARLLHVALHAAQHGRAYPKGLNDLSRACDAHDLAAWRQAAQLAERLDAVQAMSAGLGLLPDGREVQQRLALPAPSDPLVLLRAESASSVALGIARFAQERPSQRVAHVARGILPTPAFLRWWTPLARRGVVGLVAGYVWRYVYLAGSLPGAIASFRRVSDRSDRPYARTAER